MIVSGKVQGVFFRASAKAAADGLGVVGLVRNLPNGSVYLEAEANEEQLQQFEAWCRKGPTRAIVDNVRVQEGNVANYREFIVQQ